MTGSRLHEHRLRFEETNDFIDFLLGLCTLTPRTLPELKPVPPPEVSSSSDEGFMHFVLGLILLASRFNRLVAMEAPPVPQDEARPLDPTLLRDLLR
jgi:hypothetical protein